MAPYMTTNNVMMLERSMDFLWTKQSAVLDNIVNAETPNYKTKYVTFEEALQARIQKASGEDKTSRDMRGAIASSGPTVRVAEEETTRMDGNGVNVAEASMELLRNTYQLQYVMDSINTDFSILRAAIRG